MLQSAAPKRGQGHGCCWWDSPGWSSGKAGSATDDCMNAAVCVDERACGVAEDGSGNDGDVHHGGHVELTILRIGNYNKLSA